MYEEIMLSEIERWRPKLEKLALDIWNHPEGPFVEHKACAWTAQLLREAGFTVEEGVGGIPTAIRASYGSGKPVYGLLGEYDALPDLSQKVSTTQEPVKEGGMGHGCGHNLLGTAHVGAAIGVKKLIEEGKLPGTVVFFGCPAEETLLGKGLMAQKHLFDELDFNISFHPAAVNHVTLGNLTGLNSFKLHFKGRTAHAGSMPERGRSALDALEMTHVGINYLREHVPTSVRIHYVITEGGTAPNIVPDKATGWYYVRALTRATVNEVYERILNTARGAALMTDTHVEVELLGGCYPTLNNQVLGHLMHDILEELPQDPWTEDELSFAAAISSDSSRAPLHTGVTPAVVKNGYGSTDAGDVQHLSPGLFFSTACYASGTAGHTWQATSAAGHSIGLKGMIHAAKAMALFGQRVMSDPQLLAAAKQEFEEKVAKDPYICPIPEDFKLPCQK